jgi:hypothetical protein
MTTESFFCVLFLSLGRRFWYIYSRTTLGKYSITIINTYVAYIRFGSLKEFVYLAAFSLTE